MKKILVLTSMLLVWVLMASAQEPMGDGKVDTSTEFYCGVGNGNHDIHLTAEESNKKKVGFLGFTKCQRILRKLT